MTRIELQQAIKALRESGVLLTPALNSKTTVLQEWYDYYLETEARQQAALEEWEELENSEETTETPDHVTDEVALIVADDILENDYGYIRTEELIISGLSVKIDCYEYGYKPFIAWDGSNFEAIEYKYIPGSLTSLKAELTELIKVFVIAPAPAPAPITITEIVDYIDTFKNEPTAQATLSNYEGIDSDTMKVTDWTCSTPLTCNILNFQVCDLPNTHAQNMTIRIISQENLQCLHCQTTHLDIDNWALKPHKTHLCLSCGEMFEGTIKGVSHPEFTNDFQITEKVEFINGRVKTYVVNSDIKIVLNQTVEREPELYIMDCEDNEHGYLEGILAEELYNDVIASDKDTALDFLAEYV